MADGRCREADAEVRFGRRRRSSAIGDRYRHRGSRRHRRRSSAGACCTRSGWCVGFACLPDRERTSPAPADSARHLEGALSRFFRLGGHASKTDAPPAITLSGSRPRDPCHRGPSSDRRAHPALRPRPGRAASNRAELGRPQPRRRQPQPRRSSACALLDCSRLQRRVSRRVARGGRLGLRVRARDRGGRRVARSGRRDAAPTRREAVTPRVSRSTASQRRAGGPWDRQPAQSDPCKSLRRISRALLLVHLPKRVGYGPGLSQCSDPGQGLPALDSPRDLLLRQSGRDAVLGSQRGRARSSASHLPWRDRQRYETSAPSASSVLCGSLSRAPTQ
jgi:hypothetical protein